MPIRLSFTSLVLSLVALLAAVPALALCEPRTTAQTSCFAGPDKTCRTQGETTIDKDAKNILACLRNDGGGLEWKTMTPKAVAPTAPSGTLCGLLWDKGTHHESGDQLGSFSFPCEGYYLHNGCPPGYTFVELTNGHAGAKGYSCIKN